MSELAPDVWDEIERQYSGGVAIAAIAKAFNVSRAKIKQTADEMGWVRGRKGKGAASPQASDAGSSRGAGNAAAAAAADRRRLLIEQQRAAWDDVCAVREDAYRLLKGEEPRTIKGLATDDASERLSRAATLLTMADKDANSLMRAQEGQRRAYGVDYKQEVVTKEDAEARERRLEKFRRIYAVIQDYGRLKRQLADCQCQQEGSKGPNDSVSPSAPEFS